MQPSMVNSNAGGNPFCVLPEAGQPLRKVGKRRMRARSVLCRCGERFFVQMPPVSWLPVVEVHRIVGVHDERIVVVAVKVLPLLRRQDRRRAVLASVDGDLRPEDDGSIVIVRATGRKTST